MAPKAAVAPRKAPRLRPEPLGQPQSALMGELAARFVTDRRHDPGCARLQRTEIGLVGGDRQEVVPAPEIPVPLHLRHRLARLRGRLALPRRWPTAANPG